MHGDRRNGLLLALITSPFTSPLPRSSRSPPVPGTPPLAHIQRIEKTTKAILGDLVVDLNAELQEKAETGAPFDYKRELKSPTAVKAVAQQIVPMYEKALRRGRVSSFSEEWQAST